MKGKKKYTQLRLWSLPVLVLYSLFFTVQIFFNFDTATAYTSAGHQQSVLARQSGDYHQSISGHKNHDNQSHSKIRLNKRFQPAGSPALNPFYVKAPLIFIEEPIKAVYPAPFHTSPTLFTSALRGPPAVVYHLV